MTERPLRATYRLQLNADFTFADAAKQVTWLARLGISHLYLSPVFEAAKGSTHGYDVVDHTKLSSVLGGREGFDALVKTAHAHGLGVILDIVPNHMSIADARNAWWWDVLENGPSSHFAHAFDVDWTPPEQQLANTVLLPVLGDHYARVLERRELGLKREGARFVITYFDHRWPVAPRSLGMLLKRLSSLSERLAFIADGLAELPQATLTDHVSVERRRRDKDVLFELLGELLEKHPPLAKAVDDALAATNQDAASFGEFLDRQNYRLAFWRTAERELDYRRFFDIATLVALRMEDPRVFAASHTLIRELISAGSIDGVRVDHVDGLADPAEYLQRLRGLVGDATIHVEKILGFDETLRPWPVEGTTGYEHAAEVTQLFLPPAAEDALTKRERQARGDERSFEALAAEARKQVLVELLAADVNRLTATLVELRERHAELRDYSRHQMHHAVRALVAAFPVYRSYVAPSRGEITDEDRALIGHAIEEAKKSEVEGELVDFIGRILRLERRGELEGTFVRRFQQLTAPAMAKGVEDTTFYRSTRLLALNEVGGSPEHFGLDVDAFHELQKDAETNWPRRLLTSSTHDTKRSEDVRARLVALAWHANELPPMLEGDVDGPTKELVLQTFIGAAPIGEDRLWPAVEKSIREAKLKTSWTKPNAEYEAHVKAFVKAFPRSQLETFVKRIENTARGISLAWTALKLTLPGVPDFYQGTELWNFALVDPDNRRPVDYALRASSLDEKAPSLSEDTLGLNKLSLIRKLLTLRRERPQLFTGYEPISGDALAFSRGNGGLIISVKHRPDVAHFTPANSREFFSSEFVHIFTRA
ncbi:MAG: malto-oligosyltrehalose synthase [Archangium sp.]